MDKKHCRGCYCNDYNYGLGGAKECWMLKEATLRLRKKVPSNQPPPWKQKPTKYPHCYHQQGYVFMEGDRRNW